MRLSIIAVVLAGILSVAPTTSSAQTVSDSQAVLSIDTKLFFSTAFVTSGGQQQSYYSSHVLIDTITKVFIEPNEVSHWLNDGGTNNTHPAMFDQEPINWGLMLDIDRKASLVKVLVMSGDFKNNEEYPRFSIRFENIPMWSDGKNFIIDIHAPFPSFYFSYVNLAGNNLVEYYKNIDSTRSHILIKLSGERLLSVLSQKENKEFRIMSNVQSHSAIAWFPPASVMRTMQVYNTLGACVKEILIQPKASSEEIAFHSLPTGHYTARLGNETHSFAVWR